MSKPSLMQIGSKLLALEGYIETDRQTHVKKIYISDFISLLCNHGSERLTLSFIDIPQRTIQVVTIKYITNMYIELHRNVKTDFSD